MLTRVGGHLVILVQEEILGRLWAEGEAGHLQEGGDRGEGQQPGPALLSAEDIVHAEQLGDEDAQGDDQLVHGAELDKVNMNHLYQCEHMSRPRTYSPSHLSWII